MNAYLSRAEREQYIRLTCLRVVIDTAIETYSGLKNIDKQFLSELRHARTRLDKALNIRLEALDPEANQNLYKAASKLKLMFLATPEAKKANEEMLALKSTLPMAMADFEDWYSFVIENSCKTCTRGNYAECPARRVLTKYDVFPADPAANGKCQYSYIGTELEAKPTLETESDTVPVLYYNRVIAQYEALQDKINKAYLPELQELRELVANFEAAGIQAVKETSGLLPATMVLASGAKVEMDLPEAFAKGLAEDMRKSGRENRGIFARQVDGDMITVDMAEVVVLKVPRLEEELLKKYDPVVFNDSGERERYRIECRCGEEYNCSMNVGRDRARCRNCKSTVFTDRHADPLPGDFAGEPVTLMTNRYWVERDIPKQPNAAQVFTDRKSYRDPCDPFK